MLCLYLGFPPSCFFFAAGRIGLLWAQLLCLCTPPVLWDGSLSVVRRLHHCPLTLLVPFPPLINILRVCSSYENLTCRLFSFHEYFYFFSSHLFLNWVTVPQHVTRCVIWKCSVFQKLCLLCLLSWDFPQGQSCVLFFPQIFSPGFSVLYHAPTLLVSQLAFSVTCWPSPPRCLSQHGWNQIYLAHSQSPILFIGNLFFFFLNPGPLKQFLLLAFC